jgi:hypothetical protein
VVLVAQLKTYSPAIMQKVNSILPMYGTSNFADILNRLWMNGAQVPDLQRALLTDPGAGNTPQDVMAALLDQGIVTEQQLRDAASSFVPPDAAKQPWPFRPENTDSRGIVVPVFIDEARKIYPDAPRPQAAPPIPAPGAGGGAPSIRTVQGPTGPAKKDMSKASPAEVEQYQREHFGNMLWVKNDPELRGLLERAAREEWTPERFRSEFENSNWWNTKSGPVRKFIERQNTDAETLNSEIDTKAKNMLATAQSLGIPLTYADLVPLATDAIRFGWDDLTIRQNIIGKVTFDPNQAGGLGAFQTQAKNIGKKYLINITDQEAFEYSKKLFTGEATEASIAADMQQRSKSAYPSIANLIESGTVPLDYFNTHINTVANLLEVDPSSIDLTDANYMGIISHTDDKGNVRPLSVPETITFVKQKDEYWKTGNSAKEVTSVLGTLGDMFGRTAV